jgi:hypothetical protein
MLSEGSLETLVAHSKLSSNASVKFKIKVPTTTTQVSTTVPTLVEKVKSTIEVITSTLRASAASSKDSTRSSNRVSRPKNSRTSAKTSASSTSTTETIPPTQQNFNENLSDDVLYLLNLTSSSNSTDQVRIILNTNSHDQEKHVIFEEADRKNKYFFEPTDSSKAFDQTLNIENIDTSSDDISASDNSKSSSFFDTYKNKFKYYYFPISVFILCLLVSVLIVFIVIFSRRQKRKAKAMAASTALAKNINDIKKHVNLNHTSYYLEPVEKLHEDEDDYDEDEDETDHDGDNSEEAINQKRRRRSSTLNGKFRQLFKSKSFKSATCARAHKSGSFDSYASSSAYNSVDSATVPVSRSVENLTLNVFVYFSVHDNQYIVDYLLPCLKSCLTIVPETRYILKVQTEKYMESFDYSMTLNPTSPNSSSNNSTDMPLIMSSRNSLTANVFILSENFYGYKPQTAADSLLLAASIKTKSNTSSRGSSGASTRSTNSGCTSSGVNSGGFMTNNFSSSGVSHHNMEQQMQAKQFKNAFKIHLINVPILMNTMSHHGGNNGNGSNPRFFKRMYDTNGRTSANSSATMQMNPYAAAAMAVYSSLVPNDLYNTHAFNEQLQFKLEKYLEHVCLRSNTFSKTNFSYVDYTKR